VTLSTSEFQPTSGDTQGTIPNQLTITLNTGTTVVWNGQSDLGAIVPTGQYYVTVHIQDGKGGETIVTRQVTVMSQDASRGLGNLVAMPNIVKGSSSTGPIVTFKTDSAQSLTLAYQVYDMAGELVKRRSYGSTGFNFATWDISSLASGCYFAVVEALNAEGGLVGRKTLKVIVVH
jgi:flagellar hook assembly protein FlgD